MSAFCIIKDKEEINMEYKISPSVMCMDLLNIEKQMKILNKYVYSYHIDIIDGVYFKNFSFTPPFMKAMRKVTDKRLDAHVMLTDPFYYLDEMIESGADCVSIHSEQLINESFRTAKFLHEKNKYFGVVLSPSVSVENLMMYIDQVDKITVMSEEPGFAGGDFIPSSIEKIRQLYDIRKEKNLNFMIEVDGVVNKEHFREYKDAGVDIYIVGSRGLFSLDDNLEKAVNMTLEQIAKA